MAMIKCRECEREISNKAEKCPHCGFPLSKKSKENKKTNVLGTVLGIIILIIGWILCIIDSLYIYFPIVILVNISIYILY